MEMPTSGGSYIRDPKTGALVAVPDEPAPEIEADPAPAEPEAPAAPEPATKKKERS